MNRIFKTAILSAAVAATTLAALPAANADEWRHYRHHHNSSNGDAIAAGILGLAAGALIVGALNNPQPDYYDQGYYVERRSPRPRPRPVRTYYAEPQVVYNDGYSMEPWSPEWYQYCSARYRTFNARTGTFAGYDGLRHFCVAN